MLSCCVVGLAACPQASERPPNIVLMISDDQGWRDYGFMGSEFVHTPHLDALAAEGIVFSHGFNTGSACRPSLRTLLTGLHPLLIEAREQRLLERGVNFPQLVAISKLATLPRLLAERGYVSFQGGKYWEGPYAIGGFTEGTAEGASPGAVEASGALSAMSGGEGTSLGRKSMEPVLDFIDRHVDQPFFVWFAPMLPHLPHDPGRRYKRHYPQRDFDSGERGYYGNVTRFDARVGELLAHLAARGLRERTVVIFLADNGWEQPKQGEPSLPYLGGPRGKMSIYEYGFRTPIVVSWPSHLAGGRRESGLVSTADLFPTILELAGLEPERPLREGRSLVPVLEGRGQITRERVLGGLHQMRNDGPGSDPAQGMVSHELALFLRERRWRYVWQPDRGREELYDIESDPWERQNLIDQHPELREGFRSEVEAWLARQLARSVPRDPAAGAAAPDESP